MRSGIGEPTTRTLVCLAALVLGLTCSMVQGADWVVRPFLPGVSIATSNIDAMWLPDGTAAIGYTYPMVSSQGELTIARLAPGEKLFQWKTAAECNYQASFVADNSGNIYFTNLGPDGTDIRGVRVGQDLGAFGGLITSAHPYAASASNGATPTMAINAEGMPVIVGIDNSGYRFLSTFDVQTSQWQTDTLTGLGTVDLAYGMSGVSQALTYDTNGKGVLSFTRNGSPVSPLVVARQTSSGWTNVVSANAYGSLGTSVAAGPDGLVGFAFVNENGQLTYGENDGVSTTFEVVKTLSGGLTPHSLAFDADGNPALVYGQNTGAGTANLVRRNAQGQWTTEELPVRWCQKASIDFDAQGNLLIAALSNDLVTVLAKNIADLMPGDFNLDDTITADDVPGMVQASVHPDDYMGQHTGMCVGDVQLLGNLDGQLDIFDQDDIRLFADTRAIVPVSGLSNRTEAYVAIDQADVDPTIGHGDGNFFSTQLATGKAYTLGDTRGDLSGETEGQADYTIDAVDIDYLLAHLDGSDARCDLNDDGLFIGVSGNYVSSNSDAAVLIQNILGTEFGDANLDGRVSFADFQALQANFRKLGTWEDGDFNGDGTVTFADFQLLQVNFGYEAATSNQLTAMSAWLHAVPEPGSLTLTVFAALGLLLYSKHPRRLARDGLRTLLGQIG